MKIRSVTDPEFAAYGHVVQGFEPECAALIQTLLWQTPMPEHLAYQAKEPVLQEMPEAEVLGMALFGGLPCQFGWCSGYNTRLNCLEYHRDSEYNLGAEDFILLLAKKQQMENGELDTAAVRAFLVLAGTLVEIFPDTLHYAPCQAAAGRGFRVIAIMQDGANTPLSEMPCRRGENRLLWAWGKWLMAHPDSPEAAQGAFVGLKGENIDLAAQLAG